MMKSRVRRQSPRCYHVEPRDFWFTGARGSSEAPSNSPARCGSRAWKPPNSRSSSGLLRSSVVRTGHLVGHYCDENWAGHIASHWLQSRNKFLRVLDVSPPRQTTRGSSEGQSRRPREPVTASRQVTFGRRWLGKKGWRQNQRWLQFRASCTSERARPPLHASTRRPAPGLERNRGAPPLPLLAARTCTSSTVLISTLCSFDSSISGLTSFARTCSSRTRLCVNPRGLNAACFPRVLPSRHRRHWHSV